MLLQVAPRAHLDPGSPSMEVESPGRIAQHLSPRDCLTLRRGEAASPVPVSAGAHQSCSVPSDGGFHLKLPVQPLLRFKKHQAQPNGLGPGRLRSLVTGEAHLRGGHRPLG